MGSNILPDRRSCRGGLLPCRSRGGLLGYVGLPATSSGARQRTCVNEYANVEACRNWLLSCKLVVMMPFDCFVVLLSGDETSLKISMQMFSTSRRRDVCVCV